MMRLFLSLLLIAIYAGYVSSRHGGIRSARSASVEPHRSNGQCPTTLSVSTTRQVASQFSGLWDIQQTGSRRILDASEKDLVELRVVVWEEAQLMELHELESNGVVTLQHDGIANRELQSRPELTFSNFTCYRTVEQIMTTMDTLQDNYPDFVNVTSIGKSWRKTTQQGGHDIKVMVLSAPSDVVQKETMMVIGGHHSRELAPPETILRWVEHMLSNYGTDTDITWILNRTNIHIVPLANPDGREIVQEHFDWYYRKNAHSAGCDNKWRDGIDLNRNYPMWFRHENTDVKDDPCKSSYSGKSALSEPESNAIYNYIHDMFPSGNKRGETAAIAESKATEACPDDTRGVLLDVHAPGDFVYFPWGHDDILSPNHLSLLTMAAKLAKAGNYTLWGPGQDDFKYFVGGDATDAAYGMDCVASFGFELGRTFYEPCDVLESDILPVTFQNLLYAAKTARAPYQIPLGPDILQIRIDDFSDPEYIEVMAKVSDDAMIVDHAKFPEGQRKRHPIATVELFMDVHPDDEEAQENRIAMQPDDGGTFGDRTFEVAAYTLDTTSWDVDEQHTLYIRATDAANHTGPVSAVFVVKS
ncbi:MAG: hypothetical protein SGILL_005781 [Bacillariaceae sp.]